MELSLYVSDISEVENISGSKRCQNHIKQNPSLEIQTNNEVKLKASKRFPMTRQNEGIKSN